MLKMGSSFWNVFIFIFLWNLQNFFINQLGNHSSSQQVAYCTIMDGYLIKVFFNNSKNALHIQAVVHTKK